MNRERAKILCVDDEPRVLEALALHLRRRYDVTTADSGPAALEILEKDGPFAVVMSDMRMPIMDGAAFLARARVLYPDTTRLLLTGHSEMQSTIAAVNQGRIFRFLAKPCPPAELSAVIEEAVEQNRLVTAERVLLEQTLRGAVQTLVDVLALVQPTSFGRATRIKKIALEIAERLGLDERWPLEVAALLSQLGMITLPASVSDKLYVSEALTKDEQLMVERASSMTDKLLAPIPRLEIVRGILASGAKQGRVDPAWTESERQLVVRSGQILHVANDYTQLEMRGEPVAVVLGTLVARPEGYAADVLAALAQIVGGSAAPGEVREVRELTLVQLRVGMVLVDEMRTTGGTLLCPRGYEFTESFIERVRNIRAGTVREPIRVVLAPARPSDAPAGVR